MDDKIKRLMGILDGGKRVFLMKASEVDADEFEYCSVISQILFGEKGLIDTLGPTWEMVHDPRFELLESLFVLYKKGMFGGDAREGLQTQQSDGTFSNSLAGLHQYSEMLGEGRFLIKVLKAFSIVESLDELFPGRKLRVNTEDSLGALALLDKYPPEVLQDLERLARRAVSERPLSEVSDALSESTLFAFDSGPDLSRVSSLTLSQQWKLARLVDPQFFFTSGYLSPPEKEALREKMSTYNQYSPHSVPNWSEDRIWGLIRLEYRNYFSRKGVPNQDAKTLFSLLKGGLLGLVSDYAEIANVQETVLLDDTNTLYTPEEHGEDAPRVAMEVEMLERALSYRAELRTTAAKIIQSLGIASQIVDVTDHERDQLLKIVYQSKWPIEKTEMVVSLLTYMNSIRLSGLTVEERRFKQLNEASASAKRYVEALRDGTVVPITRETDGVVETSVDLSEKLLEKNMGHPLFAHILLRYTGIEKRLIQKQAEFLAHSTVFTPEDLTLLYLHPTSVLQDLRASNSEFRELEDLVMQWSTPGTTVVTNIDPTPGQLEQLREIERLSKAMSILDPVITQLDYQLTEQGAFELLAKVEDFDPTPMPETQEYEGTFEESKLLPVEVVQ